MDCVTNKQVDVIDKAEQKYYPHKKYRVQVDRIQRKYVSGNNNHSTFGVFPMVAT